MAKRSKTKVTLSYASHALQPEDLLDFVELTPFTRRWAAQGLNDEDDLTALQLAIMANPTGGDVIPGTEGLRKVRFAPASWHTGKRGAARVLYVYFQEYHIVLLCFVYAKNETDDISAAAKKQLNKVILDISRLLKRRRIIR